MGLPEVLDEMEVVVGIAPVMDGCHAPPIATNLRRRTLIAPVWLINAATINTLVGIK